MNVMAPRIRYASGFAVAAMLLLAACGSSSSGGSSHGANSKAAAPKGSSSTTNGQYGTLPAASGTPIKGGTVTYPIIAGSQPTWILPIQPGSQFTVYNSDFEIPMYRPLYWTTVGNRPVINSALSLAKLPVYANANKTVTITLNPNYKWADGHAVTAQDIIFSWELLRSASVTTKDDARGTGATRSRSSRGAGITRCWATTARAPRGSR